MEPTSKVRLAAASEPGATLLNAYSYLVLVAGLYAHVASFDHRPQGRKKWLELSDHILSDLGGLFAVWDTALQDKAVVERFQTDQALFAYVERQCLRGERLLRLLDVWTGTRQWASTLELLEAKWCRMGQAIIAHIPTARAEIERLTEASQERRSLLQGIFSQLSKESAHYREPTLVMIAQKKAGLA